MKPPLAETPTMIWVVWLDPNWFSLQPHEETNTNNQQDKQVTINSVDKGTDKHPRFDVHENMNIIQIFCREVWQNESKDKNAQFEL